MPLNDDIAARETEQARLATYLRQREALTRNTACTPDWVAEQAALLEERIDLTRELIAEYGDRILDTWQTENAAHRP